ncbi:hypothetical protein K7X08_037197 [Anisodus acutangulus]|uniref:Uncharacterized protein n=1 Tax=Anisodus acutangulus TaxID=402998 RepID=A0A9Q1N0W2_9SOLA|nr:hypothetical protein K7X08_037197 [Anisodus acutangulus]
MLPILPELIEEEVEITEEARSWKNLFSGNRSAENGMTLSYFPPTIVNGIPTVQLKKEEVDSGFLPHFGNAEESRAQNLILLKSTRKLDTIVKPSSTQAMSDQQLQATSHVGTHKQATAKSPSLECHVKFPELRNGPAKQRRVQEKSGVQKSQVKKTQC